MDGQRATDDLSIRVDRRLVLRASPIEGVGAFAAEEIGAGTVLTRVTGGLVMTAAERAAGVGDLAIELYAEDEIAPGLFRVWPKFVDYYFNHSCDPNVVENAADGTQMAARTIRPDEELTIDYLYQPGGRWPDEPCRCGSDRCRNAPVANP